MSIKQNDEKLFIPKLYVKFLSNKSKQQILRIVDVQHYLAPAIET